MTLFDLEQDEIAPFYLGYVANIKSDSLKNILEEDRESVHKLFDQITDEKGLYAYATGKWTIKEMILHCIDAEIVFNSRALMFARGEQQDLPGYDHEAYVKQSNANSISLTDLHALWSSTRQATKNLFNTFSERELLRSGTASQNKLSVRGLALIIPGHVLHHMGVLREKYGLDV